jgi:hypothetical protein
MVALGCGQASPCLSALALATPDFNSYMAVEPYASPRRFAYEACTQPVADSAGTILRSLGAALTPGALGTSSDIDSTPDER